MDETVKTPDFGTFSLKKKKAEESSLLSPNDTRRSIPWSVVGLWMGGGGGLIAMFAVFCAFALASGSTAFSSWWLKKWFQIPSFPPLVMHDRYHLGQLYDCIRVQLALFTVTMKL